MNELSGWLRSRSKPVRGFLALTIGLGELSGILLIVQTALLVRIGNGVIFDHKSLATLGPTFGYLLTTILVRSVVGWGSRRAGFACAGVVKHSLRQEMLSQLASAGPTVLAGQHAGEIANSVVDGVEALDGYYSRYLPQRAIASLLPLTVLAVVFPLDWISGTTLLVTAIFIPILMFLIGEDAHDRNQRLWEKLAQMSARFLDTLQGIVTLKIFDASRREARIIEEISEEYRRSTMSVMRVAFTSALMLELISTVSIAIVAIASGLRMLAGTMSFAPGYFILLLAPEYFLTLRNLGTYYHSRMEALSAAEHIMKVLRLSHGRSSQGPAELPASPARPATGGSQRPRAPGEPAAVSFRGVGFRYASDREVVLDELSLDVKPGEHVAIFGRSGSGKSTLLAMLLGFVEPTRGHLSVDGRQRGEWDSEELLRRIAWLPQRPTAFHATVAENIALGRPDVSSAQIEEAARLAYADEFIRRLPHGYETILGEGGRTLSGGQIQRIAVARLFLREAPLVLLDEPTAHLDAESEAMVRESIARLTVGRTLILVSHRTANVKGADRIVVLSGGRITEQGSHGELLALKGRYAEMIAPSHEEDFE